MKRECPILKNPRAGCYCRDPKSLNIKAMLNYCADRFEECPIYKDKAIHEEPAS